MQINLKAKFKAINSLKIQEKNKVAVAVQLDKNRHPSNETATYSVDISIDYNGSDLVCLRTV